MFSSLIMYHIYIYGAPGSYLLMEAHIFLLKRDILGDAVLYNVLPQNATTFSSTGKMVGS